MRALQLNASIQNPFRFDQKILLDVTSGVQTILPLLNIFIIHPSVLFLLSKRKKMRQDIRIGYCATVIGLIFSDSILFGLRFHLLSPCAGIYCDGPLCREGRLAPATIRDLLVLSIMANATSFFFLLIRMHQMVLRRSEGRWLLSNKSQIIVILALFTIELFNVYAFAEINSEITQPHIFFFKYKFLFSCSQNPELAWLAHRGGVLLTFGGPPKSKNDLVVAFVLVIVLRGRRLRISDRQSRASVDSHLDALDKQSAEVPTCESLVSSRTLILTDQMLALYKGKLNGSLLHVLVPLLFFLTTILVDMRDLIPEGALAFLRLMITMLAITNPLQFSLMFILKTRGHRKLLEYLQKKRFSYESTKTESPDHSTSPRLSTNSTKLLQFG